MVCSEIRNKWTSVWSFSLFPTEGTGNGEHGYINAMHITRYKVLA
jgi:hypothetical protein